MLEAIIRKHIISYLSQNEEALIFEDPKELSESQNPAAELLCLNTTPVVHLQED